MSADSRIDDYWTQQPTARDAPPKSDLTIEMIEGVEPLDAQFGTDMPKTVPDALYEMLFGAQCPARTEQEQGVADFEKLPPVHTYAILDAAKMTGLLPLLEPSGLEFRCLFKGAAYDELETVAPWLVRLKENNSFSRNLFTAGPQPWVFWDDAPGIFIRSASPFSDVWGHFRKFTKAKGDHGAWFYFRFWEPIVLRDFSDCLAPASLAKFLGPHRVISCLPDGTAMALSWEPAQEQNLMKPDPHDA